jgi:hypothetical protein
MAASGPGPKLGTLGTILNQTGNLTSAGLQYTGPTFTTNAFQNKGPKGKSNVSASLGYSDQGLIGDLGYTTSAPLFGSKSITDRVQSNLGYNPNQGAFLREIGGLKFNVLDSKMRRPGDTQLSINPYLGMTATSRSLTEGGAYNLNNQYTPDGKPRSLVEAGANLDFKTMLTKNLSLSGQAGLGFSGTGTTTPINGQGTGTKIHNPGDYGTDLRIMPTASIGLNYNLDGVGKLLYKKPTHKPKSKDTPNPRLANSNKTPEFTRNFDSNPRF